MIVGRWRYEIYEASFSSALAACGVEVVPCKLDQFFQGGLSSFRSAIPILDFMRGRLNEYILSCAYKYQPEWILFWRPTHIIPKTLKTIADFGIKTVSFNNDDPFGPQVHGNVPWHHHFLWHWHIKCLPAFDRNFFYRRVNCDEALVKGARHADVMLPYFIPEKDRPVELNASDRSKYVADVAFVGHYEPDGREKSVHALVNAGVNLKIWGGHYWSRKLLGDLYDKLQPIVPAEGDDYAKALCGAKVCLAFLSKLNRDTYTRRCFEIPACGRVMLAERTDDLMQMFKEDEEACFFSTVDELVNKVNWLLENSEIRERIAKAGQRRVWTDGHDVNSRAQEFITKLNLTTI